MNRLTSLFVMAVLTCSTALRSSPQKVAFDVVSIRPNDSGIASSVECVELCIR